MAEPNPPVIDEATLNATVANPDSMAGSTLTFAPNKPRDELTVDTVPFSSPSGMGPLPSAPPGLVIESELGAGGMGVVYLAKQQGLNRAVALKTIRPGVRVGDQHLRRFLVEAEAVAAVRHPNVVEVYGYGEHDGRPYMLLEFCPGGDLTGPLERADEQPDRFRWAAEVTAAVADGVNAAHALGIVHRDLKPHNVLLAADGTPKVTDFGLAKRGTGTDLTQTQAVMGTPAYMSPEQAGGGTKFVGPEADVWSLGVMLYELVGGGRPFVADSPLELLAKVANDPVPPLKARCPAVPGDLALVVMKCLSKEPRERYHTAGELATDLRRWLAGEPILARPPGVIESAVRWARRNPKVAASLGVAAAALIVGTVASTCLALWATSEAAEAKRQQAIAVANETEAKEQKVLAVASEKEAAEQRTRADEEAVRAKVSGELTAFLRDVFAAGDPTGFSSSGLLPPGDAGRKVTAGDLLARGSKLITDGRFKGTSPADRLTRAALLDALGDVSRSLGLSDRAGPLLKEAVAIRDELLPAGHPDRQLSRFHLGIWHVERGDMLEAEALFLALLAEYERAGTADSLAAADTLIRLSSVYQFSGHERAVEVSRQARDIRLKQLGDAHRDTAVARLVLAASLFGDDRPADAMAEMKPALKVLQAEGVTADPAVKAAMEYQGALVLRDGKWYALALAKLKTAYTLASDALGTSHPYLAVILAEIAFTHKFAEQPAEAEVAFQQAVDLARRTAGLENPKAVLLVSAYAELLCTRGKKKEAWALVTETVDTSTKRYGKEVPWRLPLLVMAALRANDADRPKEVAAFAADALAEYRRRPANHRLLQELAVGLGDLADLTQFREVHKVIAATPDDVWKPSARWRQAHDQGTTYAEKKLWAEAAPFLRSTCKGAADAEKAGVAPGVAAYSFQCLGRAEWAGGRFAEAEEAFRAAVACELRDPTPILLNQRADHLLRLLALRGKTADLPVVALKYAKPASVAEVRRAFAACVRAATVPAADRPALVEEIEKAFGKLTEADTAAYRARAVVMAGGDAKREAERLDAVIAKGGKTDHTYLARAVCAVAAGQPPAEWLAKVVDVKRGTALARVHSLVEAVAAFRNNATDKTRAAVETELARAAASLEDFATHTDPDFSGYAITSLLELRWWMDTARADLKKK